jgi:3-oxoacyl-[acyl-carrier-protein] synthase II
MHRVVVTGIGLITPLGNTTTDTWKGLCAGVSGIAPITAFDTSDQAVTFAGEVRELDVSPFMDRKEQQHHDRFVCLGVAAAMEAIQQADLDIRRYPDDVGIMIGSAGGGLASHETQFRNLFDKGPHRISPHYIHQTQADALCGYLAIHTGARGPNFAPVAACTSGATAIGEAFEIIRRGDASAMLAGGVDCLITPICLGAFANAQALSRRNDAPTKASRPFDRQRDGLVLSEGAGILLLEAFRFARARRAPIFGEIIGYGTSNDAYHVTHPAPDGKGLQLAMQRAIKKSGISPKAIGYINAHGTSTKLNDSMETRAVKAVFGKHAYRIPMSSTKSMIGHTMGAAGAIEAAITLLSLQEQVLTPTINLEDPDPECDLDYVPNAARQARVKFALSNSVGFGGHNTSLVLRGWKSPKQRHATGNRLGWFSGRETP